MDVARPVLTEATFMERAWDGATSMVHPYAWTVMKQLVLLGRVERAVVGETVDEDAQPPGGS